MPCSRLVVTRCLLANPKLRVLALRSRLDGIGDVVLASFHAGIIEGRVIPALRVSVEGLLPFLKGNRFILGGDLNTARGAAAFWPGHGRAEFFAWITRILDGMTVTGGCMRRNR